MSIFIYVHFILFGQNPCSTASAFFSAIYLPPYPPYIEFEGLLSNCYTL